MKGDLFGPARTTSSQRSCHCQLPAPASSSSLSQPRAGGCLAARSLAAAAASDERREERLCKPKLCAPKLWRLCTVDTEGAAHEYTDASRARVEAVRSGGQFV